MVASTDKSGAKAKKSSGAKKVASTRTHAATKRLKNRLKKGPANLTQSTIVENVKRTESHQKTTTVPAVRIVCTSAEATQIA